MRPTPKKIRIATKYTTIQKATSTGSDMGSLEEVGKVWTFDQPRMASQMGAVMVLEVTAWLKASITAPIPVLWETAPAKALTWSRVG
jgi:hypothetical protein